MLKLDSHLDSQIEYCKLKEYGYGENLKWWQVFKKNRKGYVLTKSSELILDLHIPGNFYIPKHIFLKMNPCGTISCTGDLILSGYLTGK